MEFEAPDPGGLYWSGSRRKRFAFCPAGYYLYHLAARDGYDFPPGSREFRLYCAKFTVPLAAWSRGIFRKALRMTYLPGGNPRGLPLETLADGLLEREFFRIERGEHRSDPKLAAAILEVEQGRCTLEDAYARLSGDLKAILEKFRSSALPAMLAAVDPADLRNRDDAPVAFTLGAVTFPLAFDLVWRDRDRLRLLDLTALRTAEEEHRLTTLALFWCRKCCSVAPDRVEIDFYDVERGSLRRGETGGRDPSQIFRDLAGEAAMWRDFLTAADSGGTAVLRRFARREQCRFCRFAGLCPAEHDL